MKICIIGAGFTGLCLLQKLKKYNNKITIELFEKNNKIGGIWSQNVFEDLRAQLHSRQYRFPIFNWKKDIDMPSSSQIISYLKEFIKYYGLANYINKNTTVSKIVLKGKRYECTFEKGKKVWKDFYDLVIHTGHSSTLYKPRIRNIIPNYHSSELSAKVINKLIKEKKKITVIGGSKSAYEIVYSFAKRNYHVNWIARKIYGVAEYSSKTSIGLLPIFYTMVDHITPFHNRSIEDSTNLYIFNNSPYNKYKNGTKSGDIIIKKNLKVIEKFSKINEFQKIKYKKKLIILDEKIPIKTDQIIFATGYKQHFVKCVDQKGNELNNPEGFIKVKPSYLWNGSVPFSSDIFSSSIEDILFLPGCRNNKYLDKIIIKYKKYLGIIYIFSALNLNIDSKKARIIGKNLKLVIIVLTLYFIFL